MEIPTKTGMLLYVKNSDNFYNIYVSKGGDVMILKEVLAGNKAKDKTASGTTAKPKTKPKATK
jgi:hypothetical protein